MSSTNTFKTVALLTALTVLLVLCGRVMGGTGGMVFCFVLALGMNFVSYWFSDKIALSMAGAREVSEAESPELHSVVSNLIICTNAMVNNGKQNPNELHGGFVRHGLKRKSHLSI